MPIKHFPAAYLGITTNTISLNGAEKVSACGGLICLKLSNNMYCHKHYFVEWAENFSPAARKIYTCTVVAIHENE